MGDEHVEQAVEHADDEHADDKNVAEHAGAEHACVCVWVLFMHTCVRVCVRARTCACVRVCKYKYARTCTKVSKRASTTFRSQTRKSQNSNTQKLSFRVFEFVFEFSSLRKVPAACSLGCRS